MRPTMLDRERAYAEWAASYPPRAHNPLMEVEQSTVLRLMPPVVGLCVLDAGCGTGRYARLLLERGASKVVALDSSEAMLKAAKPLEWLIRAELTALPLADASFEVVVSGLALPDVSDLGRVVGEWQRVLRPRGYLVYSTLHPDGATLGWTRTFETSHGYWELPAHWHTPSDHREACASAGLAIETVAEPSLDQGNPVAFVLRARRTG